MTITPLFLIPVLIGPVMLLVGYILMKHPPKKINWWYGYRTAASMNSQERWEFAQTYSGRVMIKSGALLLIFAVPGGLLNFEIREGASVFMAIGIMLLFILIPIIKTERALKNKFGKF